MPSPPLTACGDPRTTAAPPALRSRATPHTAGTVPLAPAYLPDTIASSSIATYGRRV